RGARPPRARLGGGRPRPARHRPHPREFEVEHPREAGPADPPSGCRMRIAALGAGRMGRGIGHVFAYAGYDVDIIDFKARPPADQGTLRDAALAEIRSNLGLLAEMGLLDAKQRERILGRITVVSLEDADKALAT